MEQRTEEILAYDNPSYFNNREISWLRFNQRVLEESINPNNPILERLRFISIFSSNLDEFFMIRVAGLKDQVRANFNQPDNKAGMTAPEQLVAISDLTHQLVELQHELYQQQIDHLKAENICITSIKQLSGEDQNWLADYFSEHIFPILTPIAIHLYQPFPLLANRSLNIAVRINNFDDVEDKLTIVQIPELITRTIQVANSNQYVFLEDLIVYFIDSLFPGDQIESTTVFRITRNADMTIHEEDARDLLKAIESELHKREWGAVVRLEVVTDEADQNVVQFLQSIFDIQADDIYLQSVPLDFTFLDTFFHQLKQRLPNSIYPTVQPQLTVELNHDKPILDQILKHDVLLHHPYESFDTTIKLVAEAARDPKVLAIKQTLYRASKRSPIIKNLEKAALAGKQVTVLVELKARFDEKNNVQWAKKLERAGCHVIYGISGLKTHSKVCLIVRKGKTKIERFVHLSTGNYNEQTANLYTDLSLISARESLVNDATHFFNFLSGATTLPKLSTLSIAPELMLNDFLRLIDREIDHQTQFGTGRIIAKMNSLTDKTVITKLYQASQSGVKIDLIVRGICCLKPGVTGVSEQIRVHSIVGRFLEHSRIYYFHNNGDEKYYLSSADWMTRNLQRRIEILFPILQTDHQQRIKQILELSLKDNTNRRIQDSDGLYESVKPNLNDAPINSQYIFLQLANEQKESIESLRAD